MTDANKVRARVWSTGAGRRRTWHYKVTRPDGETVLYDNTGHFDPILRSALIRVEALRHMVIAGHELPIYQPSTTHPGRNPMSIRTTITRTLQRRTALAEAKALGIDEGELLRIAITAAKLGLTGADLEPMARNWHLTASRLRSIAALADRYAKEITPKGTQ